MRKTKEQNTNKGITLIALVITIIVMLILVAVTITVAVNRGLFEYASRAARETNSAIQAEQTLANGRVKIQGTWYNNMGDYIDEIPSNDQGDGIIRGPWIDNGNKTYTHAKTKLTVNIGDYVNYECPDLEDSYGETYEVEWRVLGVENGQLQLLSNDIADDSGFRLQGKDGYINGVTYLDEICEKYIDGEIIIDARSIKIEDINKVTGYIPDESTKCTLTLQYDDEYGDSYLFVSGEPNYMDYSFVDIDGTRLVTEEEFNNTEDKTGIAKEIIVEDNFYSYTASQVGLVPGSVEYDMLFDDLGLYNNCYHLASPYFSVIDSSYSYGGSGYGYFRVYSDYIEGQSFWITNEGYDSYDIEMPVRAVATLSSEVVLNPVQGKTNEYNPTLSSN